MPGERCRKCGKKLEYGELSCPVCGTPCANNTGYPADVPDSQSLYPQTDTSEPVCENVTPEKKGISKRSAAALIASAAVIAVIGIGAALGNRHIGDSYTDLSSFTYPDKENIEQDIFVGYSEDHDNADAPLIRGEKSSKVSSASKDSSPSKSGQQTKKTETEPSGKTISWDDSWIDSFESFNGYMDKNGYDQNELWFQDVTGDDEPELIVGGYGIFLGQAESHIFEIYSENKTIACGDDICTFADSYGHSAFFFYSFRSSDGSLIFADERYFGYTDTDVSGNGGAYEMYKYSFGNGTYSDQLIYFCYSDGSFSSFNANGSSTDPSGVISAYDSFFSGLTPLKANIKTIKLSDYKSMSRDERTQALTDSYNAFSYSEDWTGDLPLEDITDKLRNSTTNNVDTSSKRDDNKPAAAAVDDIATAFSKKLDELLSDHPDGGYYYVDIDSDGCTELLFRNDCTYASYSAEVYEYKNGSVDLLDEIPALGGRTQLYYSTIYNKLVVLCIGPASPSDYPSGNAVILSEITKSSSSVSTKTLVDTDAEAFSAELYGLNDIVWL